MSNFDRNAPVWGAGRAQQTSAVEMDQGLRSFMLGVYNNMVIGLAISALFALGINKMAVTDQANAVAKIGNTSFTVHQEAWQNGQLGAQGNAVVVHYDFANRKPLRIPDDIRARLQEHFA